MPKTLHLFYLREFYKDNKLAQKQLVLGGQTLDLSDNLFTSLDPSTGPTGAMHLVTLNVSRNRLTTLPATINRLTLLADLYAASNLIDRLPDELGSLNRRLTRLVLSRNCLGQPDALAPIWKLAALVELDLSANGLRTLPAEINDLASLCVLRVSGNRLTDLPSLAGIPSWMGQPSERYRPAIYANDNCFTTFPESLLVLRSLHTLWLDSNPIVTVPAQVGDIADLRVLSISLAQTQSRLAPLPGTLTVGNINRLYACDTIHRPKPTDGSQPAPLAMPMFLDDTDVPASDRLPDLAKQCLQLREVGGVPPPRRPFGISQMTGSAPHALEDAVAVTTVAGRGRVGVLDYFAVFDGHGGHEAAAFCQTNFHDILSQQLATQPENAPEEVAVQAALRSAFFTANERLRAQLQSVGRTDTVVGCTATVVLISKAFVYCANVGDSAAVLARRRAAGTPVATGPMDEATARSQQFETVRLSSVHRPDQRFEAARVIAGGGFVSVDRDTGGYRMHHPSANNGLGVTRSLGDFPMARAISAEPSIIARRLTTDGDDLFIVLACDGVTDVLRDEDMVVIAAGSSMEAVATGQPARVPNSSAVAAAAHRLRSWAYALDSQDDLSAVVIDLATYFK